MAVMFLDEGTYFDTTAITTTTTGSTLRAILPVFHELVMTSRFHTDGMNATSSFLSTAPSDATVVFGDAYLGKLGGVVDSMGEAESDEDWLHNMHLDHHDAMVRGHAIDHHNYPTKSSHLHYEPQKVSKETADKVSFVFIFILIPLFSICGSLGNILSLVVLVQQRMRNATNMLLAALAISDLMVLLHAAYFSFLRIYKLKDPEQGSYLRSVTFPVLGAYSSVFTARITTCLTTMLSLERLVAVYFPMTAKTKCDRTTTAVCIALIYIITPILFLPAAFKYQSRHKRVDNRTLFVMELTTLGQNKAFFSVYGNVLTVLFRLLPIIVLIVVNILIAVAIKRIWHFRRTLSDSSLTSTASSFEQTRITVMLITVSTVFLVCILPGAVHNIYTQSDRQYSRFGAKSNIYNVLATVTYFLETVNSSVNFFIYMAFSTKFKRTYKEIFCCRRRETIPRSNVKTIFRFSLRGTGTKSGSVNTHRNQYSLTRCRQQRSQRSKQDNNGKGEHGGNNDADSSMKNGLSPEIAGTNV